MATVAEEEFKPFTVLIKNHYDPIYSLRLQIDSADITVGKLKGLIEDQHKGNPAVQIQMLVFRGKLVESRTPLLSLYESAASLDATMCMHMTLRGGNTTAKEIGLCSASPTPHPPSPKEAAMDITATPLCDDPDVVPEFEEEEQAANKQTVDPNEDITATTDSLRIQSSQSSTSSRRPMPSLRQLSGDDSLHRQHSAPHFPPMPGAMSFPPRAATYGPYGYPPPYAAVPPNAYFGPQTPSHYPHHPAYPLPPPPPSSYQLHPSHSFGPPTLVQQSSNPGPSPMARNPMMNGHPPPFHYPPMSPYGPYPYAPSPADPRMGHMGHHGTAFGYPPSHAPYAQMRPQRSEIPQSFGSQPTAQLERSKSDSATVNKANKKKADDTENVGVVPAARGAEDGNRDIAAVGGYGMRRRRVPLPNLNGNIGNNPGIGNDRQNVNNALQAEAVDNNVDAANVEHQNNNVGDNADADANEGPGFMIWLIGAMNINVLIRLGMFMWFIGSNLSTYRYIMVLVAVGLYYMQQIGLLGYLFGNIQFGRGNQNNEPRHRDPNAPENTEQVPPEPLSYVELIQRALIGFALSLWPTWDHRQMYPVEPARR